MGPRRRSGALIGVSRRWRRRKYNLLCYCWAFGCERLRRWQRGASVTARGEFWGDCSSSTDRRAVTGWIRVRRYGISRRGNMCGSTLCIPIRPFSARRVWWRWRRNRLYYIVISSEITLQGGWVPSGPTGRGANRDVRLNCLELPADGRLFPEGLLFKGAHSWGL